MLLPQPEPAAVAKPTPRDPSEPEARGRRKDYCTEKHQAWPDTCFVTCPLRDPVRSVCLPKVGGPAEGGGWSQEVMGRTRGQAPRGARWAVSVTDVTSSRGSSDLTSCLPTVCDLGHCTSPTQSSVCKSGAVTAPGSKSFVTIE